MALVNREVEVMLEPQRDVEIAGSFLKVIGATAMTSQQKRFMERMTEPQRDVRIMRAILTYTGGTVMTAQKERFFETKSKGQRDAAMIEALTAPMTDQRRRFIERMPQYQRDTELRNAINVKVTGSGMALDDRRFFERLTQAQRDAALWESSGSIPPPVTGPVMLSHSAAGSVDNTNVTTPAINTTGADFLIIAINGLSLPLVPPNIIDSKGNTWNALTTYPGNTTVHVRFYWCKPTSVGTNHTISVNYGASYAAVFFAAFSGLNAAPFEGDSGSGLPDGGAAIISPGSLTPSYTNSLILSFAGGNTAGTNWTVDSGFTILDTIQAVIGSCEGGSLAFKVQSGAPAAINPIWNAGNTNEKAVTMAVFRNIAAPAPGVMTLISHSIGETSATTATSPAINTTGANLLIACVSWSGANLPSALTDNKGNTWIGLTARGGPALGGGPSTRIYWSKPTSVGTGHTVTVTIGAGNTGPTINFAAFAGAAATPFDKETGISSGGGASVSIPGISTSIPNSLLVSHYTSAETPAITVDAGFTLLDKWIVSIDGTFGYTAGFAYQFRPVIASVGPTTWSQVGSSSGKDATLAIFKPA